MLRNTLSNRAFRSGESWGIGRWAFASASITKRSAASPIRVGIAFIAVAISYYICHSTRTAHEAFRLCVSA